MTEARSTATDGSRADGRPTVSQLASDALLRVERCPCPGPASVVVLRSFDRASRRRAAETADALLEHDARMVVSIRAVPLLAAFGREVQHRCAVIDATGRATRGALLGWRWEAASGHDGTANACLGVRVDGGEEVLLAPGGGLVVAPGADRLELRPEDPDAGTMLEGGTEVQVRQVAGLHRLYRDGVPVGGEPSPVVRVALVSPGVARRVG